LSLDGILVWLLAGFFWFCFTFVSGDSFFFLSFGDGVFFSGRNALFHSLTSFRTDISHSLLSQWINSTFIYARIHHRKG
jgi:hypothetical protein